MPDRPVCGDLPEDAYDGDAINLRPTSTDPGAGPAAAAGTWQQGTESRGAVSRWVVTLTEPLISTRRREMLDADMAWFINQKPVWAYHWTAGVLHDLAHTLPPDDPWRGLSATIDLAALTIRTAADTADTPDAGRDLDPRLEFHNPTGAAPPASTGAALPDGQAFGTVADSADLIAPELGDPETDVGLAGLVEPLGPVSSAIAGFATADIEVLLGALSQVHQRVWRAGFTGDTSAHPGVRFLDAVAPVLRRYIHRRRLYTGPDDTFPTVAGFGWIARADRLCGSSQPLSAELGLAETAAINPASYRDLVL